MRTFNFAMAAISFAVGLFFGPAAFRVQGQTTSSQLSVDQFGYLPQSVKTAVISFTPGSVYKVMDVRTNQPVFEGAPVVYDNGNSDAASGDRLWWFDFSPVATSGQYYILDVEKNLKSYSFSIGETVYDELLKHAVRMFFYQRAGCTKEARYAGEGWADKASHVGALQDKNCRLYNKKNDATTERDLHGGWFDAGDYNKYTNWAATYIETMLLSYLENPDVWTDDYNLPESGNGIPDILDEARWGMDWLLRMQETDGSVLCVVGLAGASPPSTATGQSLYGPATTMATLSAIKAFALGYKVYGRLGMTDYADRLQAAALKAWEWAKQNPKVIFHNNSSSDGSTGLGAGDQEVNENYNREAIRITAALYLYEMTGDKDFLSVFENNYTVLPLFAWNNFVQQYWHSDQITFMYYLSLDGVSETIKNRVKTALKTGFDNANDYIGKIGKDGYRSYIRDYNWGSNKYKSDYGLTFYCLSKLSFFPDKNDLIAGAAEDYLHYIHGVNPMGLVYLTNMNAYGASNSLTEIYHTWFCDKSVKWDKVGVSAFGPAPGYLSGGPNANYKWDGCCPQNCGSAGNNAGCTAETIPVGLPAAKMYKDFNTNWPLNSWEITEPMGAYQIAYIRLLSKYVSKRNSNSIETTPLSSEAGPEVFPNPARSVIHIRFMQEPLREWKLFDAQMHLLGKQKITSTFATVDVSGFPAGVYFFRVTTDRKNYLRRVTVY